MSGTLSPISQFVKSLGLDAENQLPVITLKNDHVIDNENVFVATVSSRSKKMFLNTHTNISDFQMQEAYMRSIG
jgi:hypothetical protein